MENCKNNGYKNHQGYAAGRCLRRNCRSHYAFYRRQFGGAVSTTHTIAGSIVGVGATKRLSAVRWGITVNLVWAWILTIPVSALTGCGSSIGSSTCFLLSFAYFADLFNIAFNSTGFPQKGIRISNL